MQTWSVPLQVFALLNRELPDIPPTEYMKHLDKIPYAFQFELRRLAGAIDSTLEDAVSHVSIRQSDHKILLKYMPTVQYGNLWNAFYRQCRGTVIDMDDMCCYMPFEKWFNVDETPETSTERILKLAESYPHTIHDKFDGSLIMFYYNRGEWHTSTNGSFDSEQAQWAMEYAMRTGRLNWLHPAYTYMFEAIYPSNRIVVNYGDTERLVLLAVRSVDTGEEMPIVPGLIDSAEPLYNTTLAQILDERDKYPATEKEGWVIHFSTLQLRVKVKCTDYVTVHRLKEHITPEGVFDMIRNDTLDDVRSVLPDDIRVEVDAIVRRFVDWERELRRKVDSIHVDDVTDNKATFMAVRDHFPNGTFEQWYALRYVRGQIDTQQIPLIMVTTFDKVCGIFEEATA